MPKMKTRHGAANVLQKPDPVSSREIKLSRATFSKRSPQREREISEKQRLVSKSDYKRVAKPSLNG